MSLKAGAKRSAVGPPFVDLIFDEEDLLVGAVGMWKSRSDFQGLWETKGNLGLVFLVFHAPGISTVLPDFIYALLLCWKRANNLRWLLAFPWRRGCRISPRLFATDPQ